MFDSARDQESRAAFLAWLTEVIGSTKEALESTQPAGVGQDDRSRKKNKGPQDTNWDLALKNLARLFKRFMHGEQKKRTDISGQIEKANIDKPKSGDWHVPLHYQNINVEHTGSREDQEDRRVEFRRRVGQRSYSELIGNMYEIVTYIEQAKAVPEARLLAELASATFMRKHEGILANRRAADEMTKEDAQHGAKQ
jgi:hypothetical protein